VGWFEAVVLGIVQGLTEFLPVSSSAHLRIVGALAGWDDPGAAFTAIIQIGTELAVLVYFARDIGRIVLAWLLSLVGRRKGDPDARMGWLIILGSIPIVLLGLIFQNRIETTFRDLRIVAIALVAFSLLLYWADRVGVKKGQLGDLTVGDGVIFGFAQSLALIPGVSRSGGTITAGLFIGYTREAAARYSFLLAIPAVLGSGLYEAYDSLKGDGAHTVEWGPTALATVISFGVGLSVIAWLLRYLNHGSFTPFVVYRIVVGLLVLGLVGAGVIPAN
jgi:undecaprenyl-diphosphatase